METARGPLFESPHFPVLETFLGGMETGLPCPRGEVYANLETFLGGMETFLFSFLNSINNFLETFLGGMETRLAI